MSTGRELAGLWSPGSPWITGDGMGREIGAHPLTRPVLTRCRDGKRHLTPKLPVQLSPGTAALDDEKLALEYAGFMNSSIFVTGFRSDSRASLQI